MSDTRHLLPAPITKPIEKGQIMRKALRDKLEAEATLASKLGHTNFYVVAHSKTTTSPLEYFYRGSTLLSGKQAEVIVNEVKSARTRMVDSW